MLILESKLKEKRLVLGDYMTVHVPGSIEDQNQAEAMRDVEERHAAFFERITTQRGETIEALAA